MVIEIAANSLQSALNARHGGASRIELCADLELGGTTPSAGLIRKVRSALDIPVFVLIRPRSGDFIYTESELEVMLEDISFCRQAGVDGIVSGILHPDGTIDEAGLKRLLQEASGMQFTFHRAFDITVFPSQSLQVLKSHGVHRILTSGQKDNAIEGRSLIRQLVEEAGDDIIIMPGCGINENNILPLAEFTGAREFHASMRTRVKSPILYHNRSLLLSSGVEIPENDYFISDGDRISRLLSRLDKV